MNSPVTNGADSRYMTALTTSLVSPMRPIGCSVLRPSYVSGACIGVLITPGEIALTRMPAAAYSVASDLVTAASPPLVRDAMLDRGAGEVEEPAEVDARDQVVILVGVLRVSLGHEYAA